MPKAISFSDILTASKQDPLLQKVNSSIKTNNWSKDGETKPFYKIREQLTTKSGIILRDTRIVVPKSLQKQILQIAHEGHQGMTKTKALIRSKVWWPGIDRDIEHEIRTCLPCISVSPASPPEPLLPSPMSNPWQKVHIDMYGPMPTGEGILGIIDSCSRWPELHIIRSTTSATITSKLNKTFTIHGFPEEIVTDNAPNLKSVDIADYCEHYAIQHTKVCPYWPQGNAEIERFYRTLGKAIKTMHVEGKDWKTSLDYFLFQYRSTPHSTTKESPAKLLMGRELRGKLPLLTQRDSTALRKAKTRDNIQKQKSKQYFDKRFKAKSSQIQQGDMVLLKQVKRNKLTTRFDVHPYRVVCIKGTVAIIERDHVQIMRNKSFLRKVPSDSLSQDRNLLNNKSKLVHTQENDDDDDLDFDSSTLDEPGPRPQFPRRRPVRVRREADRWGDM